MSGCLTERRCGILIHGQRAGGLAVDAVSTFDADASKSLFELIWGRKDTQQTHHVLTGWQPPTKKKKKNMLKTQNVWVFQSFEQWRANVDKDSNDEIVETTNQDAVEFRYPESWCLESWITN